MTYLFKLVRRLAISQPSVTLPFIALLAACAGDSTSPDVDTGTAAGDPVALQVFPRSVTIETSQRVQFRGQSAASTGRSVETSLVWTASGGSIRPDGSFSASATGMYMIFARGRGWKHTDTALVHVVPPQPKAARIVVAPHPITVETGATRDFTASAFLGDGSPVQLGVTWSATGGTVDGAGSFTADSLAGDYHVIASNLTGTVADTAQITVVSPSVTAPGHPVLPTHTRVIVTPASVSLTRGAQQQYRAYAFSVSGDSVAVRVSYKVTGGKITRGGLYTAGQNTGTYRVIATSDGMADTATVRLTASAAPAPTPTPVPAPAPTPAPPPVYTGEMGVPVGLFGLISAGVSPSGYTMSLDGYTAGSLVSRVVEARGKHMQLLMNMTGGAHNNYKTNGVFDMAKWRARMDTYNTPAIKAAVAAGVADGTIVGNSVMDEPMANSSMTGVSDAKSWGPPGTMTKVRVDEMCGYVKAIFPTLPVGVVHDHDDFEPTKSYRTCGFIVSQYRWSKTRGDVKAFRDAGLALARRDGHAIAFSLNILHGGLPGTSCPKYGDDSPSGTLCPMTPDQIREWGTVLGSAGCALTMWRYEPEYFNRSDIQTAVKAVVESLARTPRKACVRT